MALGPYHFQEKFPWRRCMPPTGISQQAVIDCCCLERYALIPCVHEAVVTFPSAISRNYNDVPPQTPVVPGGQIYNNGVQHLRTFGRVVLPPKRWLSHLEHPPVGALRLLVTSDTVCTVNIYRVRRPVELTDFVNDPPTFYAWDPSCWAPYGYPGPSIPSSFDARWS